MESALYCVVIALMTVDDSGINGCAVGSFPV